MNPYWGKGFFAFIVLFFHRMGQLLTGEIGWNQLASDEIQVLILSIIGVASALIGVFLVLKKMTMMANALSHTVLLGIVLSYLGLQAITATGVFAFNATMLLIASLITAVLTVTLIEVCQKFFKLQEDASIGLIFTFLFALGVVLVTIYSRNTHLGVEAIMGNMDALHQDDLGFAFSILCVNIVMVLVLFNYYKLLAFDPVFTKCVHGASWVFQYLLMLQTALTAVGAFRAVGVFLFLIFLTAPVLSAKLFTKKLKVLIAYAMFISLGCALLSVALSRHLFSVYGLAVSTAGLACVCTSLTYPLSLAVIKIKTVVLKSLKKRSLERVNYAKQESL